MDYVHVKVNLINIVKLFGSHGSSPLPRCHLVVFLIHVM